MEASTKSRISEVQAIMSKMSLEVCFMTALPEFGVRWRDVARAVRSARLPMTSASVARVLCRHARALPPEELDHIAARLQLKLVATQRRRWHALRLEGAEAGAGPEPGRLPAELRSRLRHALAARAKGRAPEVETIQLGSWVYVGCRVGGSHLWAAAAPGLPAVLVSALAPAAVLKALAAALGYTGYSDARLHGPEPESLLRLALGQGCAPAPPPPPPARPAPARDGLDYTGRDADARYIDEVLGPDPPLLTHLSLTTTAPFFDRSRLGAHMRCGLRVRTASVARSLRAWAACGALRPGAALLQLLRAAGAD